MPFSRKFANDSIGAGIHRSIYFMPKEGTTNEQIIEKLKDGGIATYCQPDGVNADNYTYFRDKRFDIGYLKIITNASCCAFTRTAGYFYLFPIHRTELKNVGLDENDLLLWIKKFNDQKIGYEYLYFGEQAAPAITASGTFDWLRQYPAAQSDNKFYWVGVPIFDKTNILKPYLHWVTLRYLWNGRVSTVNTNVLLPGVERLSYYNIPRVTMMLHEEYNLPFLKAFLYAHVAHPWAYPNSMCWSDYVGLKYKSSDGTEYDYSKGAQQAPCLNLKKSQFKMLWDFYGKSVQNTSLNGMLTQAKWQYFLNLNPKPEITKIIPSLEAKYDGPKVMELFQKCDYAGFIKEIRDSYKVKKGVKTNEKVSA